MQVTNLAYFYETARKVRGGKWVWVKDSNGESRKNVLLGGTILNPNKGFGHLWAGQLVQYTPGVGCLIFRSFAVKANAASNATTVYLNGDGYSDAPEVGMYLMIAPDATKVITMTADTTTGDVTTSESDYSGTYAKVTAVEYNSENEQFKVTLLMRSERLSPLVTSLSRLMQKMTQHSTCLRAAQAFLSKIQTHLSRQTEKCCPPVDMGCLTTQIILLARFMTNKRGLLACNHCPTIDRKSVV